MTTSDNLDQMNGHDGTDTAVEGDPGSPSGTGQARRVTSRHALVADCFEMMADVLGPFIDQRMGGYFDDEESWAEAAANRLGRPNEHGETDPLFQLLVLRRFWGPVFADYFGVDLRGIVGELIDTRNKWAHFSLPRDPDSLDRSVLAIERLISPLAPEQCRELRRIRAEIRASPHTARETPAGHGNGLTAPPEEPDPTALVPSETEVAQLASQLAETESVFLDLQEQYGDVVSKLESSRQVAARKQLHLSALEEQLVLIQSRTSAAEAILAEERTTRYRIEWLVVGLLATLTLFLVLANS